LFSSTPVDTERGGKILGGSLPAGSVVVLSGALGAGKTVLVKGIAAGLNIQAPVLSPSYTIAATYDGSLPLTHVDLYRTSSDEELELFGFNELIDASGITVIEWGEKAARLLDEDAVRVAVGILTGDGRTIDIVNIPEELARRLGAEFAGARR